jgi:ABC-2 type transport system permease protein
LVLLDILFGERVGALFDQVAGLLGLSLTTSAISTAVGLSADLGSSAIDRFRTLPMWRPSVLIARALADVFTVVLCSAVVVVTGLLVG